MSLLSRMQFAEAALKYLGYSSTTFISRYRPVGPNDDMSCSGFICWISDELGLTRPLSKFTEKPVRTSREMFYYWGYPINMEEAEKGDLVFFSNNGALITHVGIYLGDETYVHSPGVKNGKIKISRVDEFKPSFFNDGHYYYRRTEEYFDIVFRQNPVGFSRIFKNF